jgi:hypothetical protein
MRPVLAMPVSKEFRVRAVLSLMRLATRDDSLERLHRAIEFEIEACSRRIDEAAADGDKDFIETVIDEECDQTEELLGLAFVAAQSFITNVRTRAVMLVDVCSRDLGIRLTFVSDPKAYDILKFAPGLLPATGFTLVEAINSVANYWKHSEEWPTSYIKAGKVLRPNWDLTLMRGNERRTAEIVASLGMVPGSAGNLRQATKALGVPEFENLSKVRQILRDWATGLHEKACMEIGVVD